MRSLLPTEQLEEVDGRLAILDIDLVSGTRFVKFWVDQVPFNVSEESPISVVKEKPMRKTQKRGFLTSEEVLITKNMLTLLGSEYL